MLSKVRSMQIPCRIGGVFCLSIVQDCGNRVSLYALQNARSVVLQLWLYSASALDRPWNVLEIA